MDRVAKVSSTAEETCNESNPKEKAKEQLAKVKNKQRSKDRKVAMIDSKSGDTDNTLI
jgi:hypothetical protein